MNLTVRKIIIHQFKGVSHAEYDFSMRTLVTGRNASGKTTIADAYYWVLTDKDYSLKSNPEVHPDFMEESEPSVTLVCDVDGKEVTLRKFQKDSRNKKQKEEGAPIRISNQYEINAVPKSQKDFLHYLEEIGIVTGGFLLSSHPDSFMALKPDDRRKMLFGLTSDSSDKDIADTLEGCEESGALLTSYTIDEIMAMKKRERKEADENIDAIPNQIVGLESAKVNIETEEFMRQKETLEAEIQHLEVKIKENPIPSIGELNQHLVMLEKEDRQLTADANAERVEKLSKIDLEIADLRNNLKIMQTEMEAQKHIMSTGMTDKSIEEKSFESLKEKFMKIKAQEYEPKDTKCPYCGQDLPVHRLDEAKKHFEEDKQREMDSINASAKETQDRIKRSEERIQSAHKRIQELDPEIIEIEKRIADKRSIREPLEKVVDMSGSEEQKNIMKKILEVKHQISMRDELVAQENAWRNEIAEKLCSIREIDDVLAQAKNNERIDSQIDALRTKQKEYAQAKADAEKILYQIQKISMAKNNMLEEQVNSHFNIVKFKLFEQLKNGEFKDCCTPTILSESGKYMVFGESANTALMLRAKLDILTGLQNAYDQHLPIFMDGAEALDDENKKQIHTDTQLIMLSVSDGDLKIQH